jgi:hypothetical protein
MQRGGLVAEDSGQQTRDRRRLEGTAAGEQLEEGHAGRPEIGASVDHARVTHLLGRHVHRRAQRDRRGGQRLEVGLLGALLGDAKIEHLDQRRAVEATGEEEVRGLDVAVDDAQRVGLGQRLAGLHHVARRVADRQGSALADQPSQIAPVEQLHDEVRDAVLDPGVEDPHGVLAAQAHGGAGLAFEARRGARARRPQQELDGQRLVQVQVCRADDNPHATATELGVDAVLAADHRAYFRQRSPLTVAVHPSPGYHGNSVPGPR